MNKVSRPISLLMFVLIGLTGGLSYRTSFGSEDVPKWVQFINSIHYRARSHPGSFDLLGYVYDRKGPKQNGALVGRRTLSECTPVARLVKETLDDPQRHESKVFSSGYGLDNAQAFFSWPLFGGGEPSKADSRLGAGLYDHIQFRFELVHLTSYEMDIESLSRALIEAGDDSCVDHYLNDSGFGPGNKIVIGALQVERAVLSMHHTEATTLSLKSALRDMGVELAGSYDGEGQNSIEIKYEDPTFIGFKQCTAKTLRENVERIKNRISTIDGTSPGKHQTLGSESVGPSARVKVGMANYRLEAPEDIAKQGYDRLEFVPGKGDGYFSLGHIRILE